MGSAPFPSGDGSVGWGWGLDLPAVNIQSVGFCWRNPTCVTDVHSSSGFGHMTQEAVTFIYRPVYRQDEKPQGLSLDSVNLHVHMHTYTFPVCELLELLVITWERTTLFPVVVFLLSPSHHLMIKYSWGHSECMVAFLLAVVTFPPHTNRNSKYQWH